MIEALKLKAMYHYIVFIQLLDSVFNVTFPALDLYPVGHWQTYISLQ
jgi:hypothetical protein